MGTYRTAQICLNGHCVTTSLERNSELSARFCKDCGSETISQCPSCKANIRGYFEVPGVITLSSSYRPPAYCYACGEPFPWTTTTIEAAKEFADELDDLTSDERKRLKASIGDLTKDNPKTEIAAQRYKRLMAKAGSEAAGVMRKILVDVLSEAARKTLFGP